MKLVKTPHALHLLFCINARHDGTPSCGDSPVPAALAESLKARFKAAKLPVRVTRTLCLGPCAQGPNVMAYGNALQENLWWQEVAATDEDAIFEEVKRCLANRPDEAVP